MTPPLFSISCTTCQSRLQVRDESLIGQILACPKCGSMVQVVAPPGWSAPSAPASEDATSAESHTAAPPPLPPSSPPLESEEPAESDGGGFGPRSSAGSLRERQIRRAIGVATVALVVLVVALGLAIVFLPKEDEPSEPDNSTTQVGVEGVSFLKDRGLFWQALPEDVSLAWTASPAFLATIETVVPRESMAIDRVMRGFGLQNRVIKRISYATNDLAVPADHAILLIELVEGQNAAAFDSQGEPTPIAIGGATCRRLTRGPWTHPFIALDKRRLLTGSEALLSAVSSRSGEPAATPEASESTVRPLVTRFFEDEVSSSPLVALAIDLGAARRAMWRMSPSWMHVWPDASAAWSEAMTSSRGIGVAIEQREPAPVLDEAAGTAEEVAKEPAALPEDDAAAVDDTGSGEAVLSPAAPPSFAFRVAVYGVDELAAAEVTTQWGRFIDAVGPLLSEADDRVATMEQSGRLGTASASALRALAAELQAALEGVAWQTEKERTRAAATLSPAMLQRIEDPVQAASGAIALWLAALETVEQRQLERLAEVLAAYRGDHAGRFPKGVLTEGLLPPETRLSWMAAMLPFLGDEDAAASLREGASWKSPDNAAVAKRTLDAFQNPAREPQFDVEGFPVSHFVGLAGVGPDAAELPADDPRVGVFGHRRAIGLEDITDGASNTIAVMPVQDALGPWAAGGRATVRCLTKAPYVNGPDGFGSGQPDGMLVLMADGSVRFLSSEVAPELVEGLATIHGGETLPEEPWWGRPDDRPNVTASQSSGVGPTDAPDPAADAAATADPAEPTPTDPPASAPDDLPPRATRPPVPRWTEAQLQERMELAVGTIDLAETPWRTALVSLTRMAGASVSFDLDAVGRAGIDVDAPVTLVLDEATLGEAIDRLLAPVGLTRRLHEGQLVVSAADDPTALRVVRYTVTDLAADAQAQEQLAGQVRRLVAPRSWTSAGGPGQMSIDGGALVVRQTAAVHHKILAFCERMRLARGLATKSQVGSRLSLAPPREAAAAMLAAPVTVNYHHPADLADVLTELERRTGARLVPNWASLAESRVAPSTPATVTVVDQPLGQTLVQLLDPLDAAYRAVDGRTIEILSKQDAAEPRDPAFFPIADLLSHGGSPEELLAQIESEIAPDSWRRSGGRGVLEFDASGQTMIILQSQDVLAAITRVLAGVRQRLAPE